MKDIDLIAHLRMIYLILEKTKDCGALNKAIRRIEATRWRKLSEEKPSCSGRYQTWRPKVEDLLPESNIEFWSDDEDEYGWDGFMDPFVSHWRPDDSPEGDE